MSRAKEMVFNKKVFLFFLYIKTSETTYYQRNRDIMLNRAKKITIITKNYCENEQKINIDHYRKMKKI